MKELKEEMIIQVGMFQHNKMKNKGENNYLKQPKLLNKKIKKKNNGFYKSMLILQIDKKNLMKF